jgi:hypothetical protein
MHMTPINIKVESYKYYFNNHNDYKATNKIWKKTYVNDFLPSIDKGVLTGIFNAYGLPEINEKRYIHVSRFQNIPIIDIVMSMLLLKFMFRIFI